MRAETRPPCSPLHLSLCSAHNEYSTNSCQMDEKMKGWTCPYSPSSSSPYTPHSLYAKYTHDASPCQRATACAMPSAWNALPLLALTFTVSFAWLLLPLFRISAQASSPGLSMYLTFCVIVRLHVWLSPQHLSVFEVIPFEHVFIICLLTIPLVALNISSADIAQYFQSNEC